MSVRIKEKYRENWIEHGTLIELKGFLQLYLIKFKSTFKKQKIVVLVREVNLDLFVNFITNSQTEIAMTFDTEKNKKSKKSNI
jgi:hypothetical protein